MTSTDIEINGDLPGGCSLLKIPHAADARGSLNFMENSSGMPFRIERVFWIYGVMPGKERGAHAHRSCKEIIIPAHGSFKVTVTDGEQSKEMLMDCPETGLYIPEMVWCRLYDFAPETVCLCLASQPYDETGYINDFRQFQLEMEK